MSLPEDEVRLKWNPMIVIENDLFVVYKNDGIGIGILHEITKEMFINY